MRVFLPSEWAFLAIMVTYAVGVSQAETPAVDLGPGGRLVYATDERGNRIPDFSNCGYAGADHDIPNVPATFHVAPGDGDDGPRIQAAIDRVAGLALRDDGFRGAVELAPGEFQVAGQLTIAASGVVLRGSGAGEGGTTLVATGSDRRTLVCIDGCDYLGSEGERRSITDDYVPVGATRVHLESTEGLRVGGGCVITRPSTAAWIKAIGADAFGVGWRPGSRDIRWERVITAIDGNTVTLDAPISTAIEQRYGGASCAALMPAGVDNTGVEDLRFVSPPSPNKPLPQS